MSIIMRLVVVLALAVHSQGAGVSLLQVAAAKAWKTMTSPAAVSVQAQSAAAQTLKALDTDGSGTADRAEIEAFAKSQGLSADEVAAEFKELDRNGNGMLEADEIQGTLQEEAESQSPSATQATAAAVPVQPPQLAVLQASRVQASQAVTDLEMSVSLLEHKAALQASREIAQELARKAASALEQRTKDLQHAEQFEKMGENLRVNATMLAGQAARLTETAASNAAAETTRTALFEVKHLEALAMETENKAFLKRKEANKAMESAMQAQASMLASVQRLRSSM